MVAMTYQNAALVLECDRSIQRILTRSSFTKGYNADPGIRTTQSRVYVCYSMACSDVSIHCSRTGSDKKGQQSGCHVDSTIGVR